MIIHGVWVLRYKALNSTSNRNCHLDFHRGSGIL